MHLPRQNEEVQNTSEDSKNPTEICIQDPSKTSLASQCYTEMCVNNKLTFGTTVQAFQIFKIRK